MLKIIIKKQKEVGNIKREKKDEVEKAREDKKQLFFLKITFCRKKREKEDGNIKR